MHLLFKKPALALLAATQLLGTAFGADYYLEKQAREKIYAIDQLISGSTDFQLRQAIQSLDQALAILHGGGNNCPSITLARVPDANLAFGCNAGWRNLRLSRQGYELILAADNLKADYQWSNQYQESRALVGAPQNLFLQFANGRDRLELTIQGKNLVGRCKQNQNWMLVQAGFVP